ncbi:subtilisin family serine protease [Sinobacterium caligoides]|uniref:Subtilisin family serine protease n=1 Tax=Sinobacterium caligoides TaxID=933926 RepID=A0A3N2DK19_9GAMM|nr:S8 family peptidase [Sinobacterium caligoides]ROS00154.1 subtilisin family serine protease [Sinobacterium caligoides]
MTHKITKTLTTFCGLLLATSALAVQSDVAKVTKSPHGSYIVIMKLKPAISYDGNISGYKATKPTANQRFSTKSNAAQSYKNKLRKDHDEVLATYGLKDKKVHDYSNAINGFSARMSYEQAKSIALNKKVAMVLPDTLHQTMTDNSPSFLGLNSRRGPWAKDINGEDVIVGIIDTGIWPEHPSFADDGSYADLGITLDESAYSSCDFGNTVHREDDAPFACNNKLLGARQVLPTYREVLGADAGEFDSARDENGHGSHTASTAAGNADVFATLLGNDLGLVSGVAPRARIIAYKALGTQGGFGSDLAAAIDQAVADGVDVINYSIGSTSYAIGPDDIAFLFAADAGVFIATSNGNSGPAPATTGSPASTPWVTSVGASTQDRTYEGSASSSDGWEFIGASITAGTDELPLVDAADAGSELCLPGELDAAVVANKIVLCKRGDIARLDKSLAVSMAEGAGMILYNANDGQSEVTDTHYVPSVHINNTDGLVIKQYIASDDSPVASIGAGQHAYVEAPSMAGFSSRGPNRLSADIIKPDITAPGVNILAADTPVNRGEQFQMISGTSMSSPHVAGMYALIKQAHPEWTAAMAKSAMMTSAHQDVKKEDGITQADAFDMGAGHAVPARINGLRTSMFNPGLVYDIGYADYLGFLCGANTGLVSDSDCALIEADGIALDPSELNLPSIGIAQLAGSQTIHRTVTRPADTNPNAKKKKKYWVHVDAPEGFKVKVKPKKLKLKAGESATYSITVTNVSATPDVWEHGSLTWSPHKKYSPKKRGLVYSPIAVKGALFSAEESLDVSGESGTSEFDVSFGYTGNYTATTQGLTPAELTSGEVSQDPDQAFNPVDGFSTAHTIAVSDAALLRIALPPEATDADADLDLYLVNPAGEVVASSGNGGTDELVEVVSPVDGDWTLWVHGWAAPIDPTPYTLYSWVIANTSGGSLTIDSAPTSATTGNTETINFSWDNATAGEWHYGLISHENDDGSFGLTRVEADNR